MSGKESFPDPEAVALAVESLADQAGGIEANYPVSEASHAEEGAK